MAATVLEKQEKRLYADDTVPLCANIVQYRSVGSHVVRVDVLLYARLHDAVFYYCAGVRDTCT